MKVNLNTYLVRHLKLSVEWEIKHENMEWLYIYIYIYIYTHIYTYLLNLVIRSINDFSQAFIFIVLMPVMASLKVLILSSVRIAVLLLRRQTWEMSLSDHSPTFLSNSSSSGHGGVARNKIILYSPFVLRKQAGPTQSTNRENGFN